jgi:anti-sigma B factor antagonist
MLLGRETLSDESSRLSAHPVAKTERRDGAVIVHLVGELDLYNAPSLREALLELAHEQPERLVVDLSHVDFVDSTALGVLIETRAKLENRKAFLLAAPGSDTHRALTISGLARHLSLHETVEAALAAPLA